MLYSEAVANVRSLLQDRKTPTRYSDDDIRVALNNALAVTYRERPDLFIGPRQVNTNTVTTVQSQDLLFELPVYEVYANSLVDYAAGWLELRDDEFTNTGRMQGLISMLMLALTGSPLKLPG